MFLTCADSGLLVDAEIGARATLHLNTSLDYPRDLTFLRKLICRATFHGKGGILSLEVVCEYLQRCLSSCAIGGLEGSELQHGKLLT